MHNGNAPEAEKYFREVIQLAPELADGYLDLGLAQLPHFAGNYGGSFITTISNWVELFTATIIPSKTWLLISN